MNFKRESYSTYNIYKRAYLYADSDNLCIESRTK